MAPRALVLFSFLGTALLAACGGGGGITPSSTPTPAPSASATATPTPSSTATPTPSSTATPTPSGTATPTPSSKAVFTGGSKTVSCATTGCSVGMTAADNGYTASLTFGSNNASASFNLTMSWATFSQITGTFTPGALPTSIGTAIIYLDLVTASTTSFSATPGVTVSGSSFPGTQCGFAFYGVAGSGTGGSPQWNSMKAIGLSEVAPSGGSFTVPQGTLPPGNTVQFDAGTDQYIALYCH